MEGKVMTIDAATVVVPNPRVLYRHLADGAGGVLLHPDTTAYHGINEVGGLIWGLVAEGISFGELMEELRATLKGAPPTLEEEISLFLLDLRDRDLISLNSTTPEAP